MKVLSEKQKREKLEAYMFSIRKDLLVFLNKLRQVLWQEHKYYWQIKAIIEMLEPLELYDDACD